MVSGRVKAVRLRGQRRTLGRASWKTQLMNRRMTER